jgi:hypothetical protein
MRCHTTEPAEKLYATGIRFLAPPLPHPPNQIQKSFWVLFSKSTACLKRLPKHVA